MSRRFPVQKGDTWWSIAVFEERRPQLTAIAFRLLGSVHEAEDAVQRAWIKASTVVDNELRNPAAYVTTVLTRECFDQLRARQRRRESKARIIASRQAAPAASSCLWRTLPSPAPSVSGPGCSSHGRQAYDDTLTSAHDDRKRSGTWHRRVMGSPCEDCGTSRGTATPPTATPYSLYYSAISEGTPHCRLRRRVSLPPVCAGTQLPRRCPGR